MKLFKLTAATLAATIASTAYAQTSYSTGFEAAEGFVPGTGPAPGASEGNTEWVQAANGSTTGTYVSGIAHSGTQSLAISRNSSNNDGVIHGIRSPELAQGAGETQSGAAFDRFTASYWFRSGTTSSTQPAFRVEINAWADSPSDRMTWLRFESSGSGFDANTFGTDADGNFVGQTLATGLTLGQWYQVEQIIQFVDGPDGGDDIVTFSLRDSGGGLINSIQTTSWDGFFLDNGMALSPVEQLNFRTSFGSSPPQGSPTGIFGYIDDVSYAVGPAAAVPEPATWAMMLGGFGFVGGALRRRRSRAPAAI